MLKAILIDCIPPHLSSTESGSRLTEAENLIKTFGGVVLVKKIQKKIIPTYKTFIGTGKIDELIKDGQNLGANILIVNNELKPNQTYNLGEIFRPHNIAVWDRIDLILKIFQKHASTREARLEIELASIKHMGPRIFGMGMQLSRQGGGIGTKGVGETNIEFMKRHLAKMEFRIKKELEDCKKVRKLHRDSRRRRQYAAVGIIGYTNAGKSSLLNALTKKGAYVADKLFATLDTRVGKMYLPATHPVTHLKDTPHLKDQKEALISDTIGFIQDLPPTLIKSFQSTLEETMESDILLHVIDISDPKMLQKIKVVNEILGQIDAFHKPCIYVFSKIDLIPPEALPLMTQKLAGQFKKFNPSFISAIDKEGIEDLKQTIHNNL